MTVPASFFDTPIDRKSTNSVKWAAPHVFLTPEAVAADPLPMWIADMDFRSPEPVVDALREAVEFGVFGYPAGASEAFLRAVVGWQAKRFGWDVSPAWILQSAGVVTALKTAVQAFTLPGDTVLIQPPVYAHFEQDSLINGRHVVRAPLQRTESGYRFDAKVFEGAIRPNTKLFILCHPHNPTGNVWSEDELRTMGEICLRHGIIVVSDEIHADLVLNPARKHVPFASLGEAFAANSVTCTAPSKTFNLAGLQCANIIVPDRRLREELHRQFDRNMTPFVNSLGMVAAEAAYTHGEPWLAGMLDYVRANQAFFARAVGDLRVGFSVLPADALYLAWMDCRSLGMDAEALDHFMLTQARLWLDKGHKLGPEGHGYMRVNLGCPRATVEEAVRRLKGALA